MTRGAPERRYDVAVVGGGQAGLAVDYYLKEQGLNFTILDAASRVGDAWRARWDSLRLFTPAAYDGLPGVPFPAPRGYYPTKDEMADYLQGYAQEFDLPVRLGRRVDSLSRCDGAYLLVAGEERYVAENVVVATDPYHAPRIPTFARLLDPSAFQIHSSAYRNPDQLPAGGDVLVVGAGNSGAEISMELAATRRTYLSGRDTGWAPAALLRSRLFWWFIDRVTADTRLGRRGGGFDRLQGTPLIGLKPEDIARAGVERVPSVEGVADGKPELADGRILEVAGVVWATGFKPDFGWIGLPVFDEEGYPVHHRGVADDAPGLYFVGLPFQHTFASAVVGGVDKDARYVDEHLAGRAAKREHEPSSAQRIST
ncbi:MAG: NAD(P)/FAD-dependent oxidoreductase [Actinomycetota bacterium]|nr:NAD(P)/FAD-dependent oxidoreductase [Actinomycetota bacterium]